MNAFSKQISCREDCEWIFAVDWGLMRCHGQNELVPSLPITAESHSRMNTMPQLFFVCIVNCSVCSSIVFKIDIWTALLCFAIWSWKGGQKVVDLKWQHHNIALFWFGSLAIIHFRCYAQDKGTLAWELVWVNIIFCAGSENPANTPHSHCERWDF